MTPARIALSGLAIWAAVFVVAIFAFPLREAERPLFESIMPVALAAAVTVASVRAFGRMPADGVPLGMRLGVRLGLGWLGVNLALDALMFSWGPMQMSPVDYVKDIGITYLLIPVIPIGMGRALDRRSR